MKEALGTNVKQGKFYREAIKCCSFCSVDAPIPRHWDIVQPTPSSRTGLNIHSFLGETFQTKAQIKVFRGKIPRATWAVTKLSSSKYLKHSFQ